MHKILIIMIYYIRSLAVHSAVLSYVLISTVSCIPFCHALTCTHTYSPLRSTLPWSHIYSYIQSLHLKEAYNSPLWSTLPYFHLYVWPAEYLCNPPVAWLVEDEPVLDRFVLPSNCCLLICAIGLVCGTRFLTVSVWIDTVFALLGFFGLSFLLQILRNVGGSFGNGGGSNIDFQWLVWSVFVDFGWSRKDVVRELWSPLLLVENPTIDISLWRCRILSPLCWRVCGP